jgi:WD40 repeat protein
LIAIGDGRNVVVIDADTGEKLGSVESAHSPAVTSIAFSPDRKRLFTAGADSTIKVFDTSYLSGPADSSGVSEEGKGQPLLTLEHDRVTSISLSRTGPDGRFGPFLLSTGLDGKAVLRPSESYGFAPSAVATSQQQNRDR